MLSDAVASLRCPVCQQAFALHEVPRRALVCLHGHGFDAAKQGYFNLLTGKGTAFEADTADMVAARHAILSAGHYEPLSRAVAGLAAPLLQDPASLVLDAGTGTGHYLRAVLDSSPGSAVGVDISKFALRRAARLNPESINLVWDIWRPLPFASASIDVVIVVFAPRNPAEFARVLRPGGRLIVVTPRPGHLSEIAGRVGLLGIEEDKAGRLTGTMKAFLTQGENLHLDVPLRLSGRELADIALMGPAGHHLDRKQPASSVPREDAVTATARFAVSVFSAEPPAS